MITIQKAQKFCLALAAIAFAVGLYAGFTEGKLDAERLAWLLSSTRTEPAGTLWPETVTWWFVSRLQHYAFLVGLEAVGGYLVLEFIGRPWLYQLYVPTVAVGSVAFCVGVDHPSMNIAALVMLMGPVGILGTGWLNGFGAVGSLIVSAPLLLSARAASGKSRRNFLILFAVLWLLMGLVTAFHFALINIGV